MAGSEIVVPETTSFVLKGLTLNVAKREARHKTTSFFSVLSTDNGNGKETALKATQTTTLQQDISTRLNYRTFLNGLDRPLILYLTQI